MLVVGFYIVSLLQTKCHIIKYEPQISEVVNTDICSWYLYLPSGILSVFSTFTSHVLLITDSSVTDICHCGIFLLMIRTNVSFVIVRVSRVLRLSLNGNNHRDDCYVQKIYLMKVSESCECECLFLGVWTVYFTSRGVVGARWSVLHLKKYIYSIISHYPNFYLHMLMHMWKANKERRSDMNNS